MSKIVYCNNNIFVTLWNNFLDIFFIYISNVFPFLGLPFRPLHPILLPLPLWGCSPMQPLPPSCPGIPLHWVIKHPQAQGPLLPLMSNKAILCHICSQSYGSLHVYSLVVGPVTRSSGVTGLLTLLLPIRGGKPPQLLQSLLQLLHQGGDPPRSVQSTIGC